MMLDDYPDVSGLFEYFPFTPRNWVQMFLEDICAVLVRPVSWGGGAWFHFDH